MKDNPMGRVGVTFTAEQRASILGRTLSEHADDLFHERGAIINENARLEAENAAVFTRLGETIAAREADIYAATISNYERAIESERREATTALKNDALEAENAALREIAQAVAYARVHDTELGRMLDVEHYAGDVPTMELRDKARALLGSDPTADPQG